MTPIKEAKTTTAFYGATPNYTFQLDDLGYVGLRDQLSACLKSGDSAKSQMLITTRSSTSSPSWRAGATSPRTGAKSIRRFSSAGAKWRARCARQAKRRMRLASPLSS